MNSIRVQLELTSPLGTPLSADTLFGHLCWGMVYHDGEAALRDFLAAMTAPDPPLVISDPLPGGYWPAPALPPPAPAARERLLERAARSRGTSVLASEDAVRATLQRPWVPHAAWPAIAAACDAAAVASALLDAPPPPRPLIDGTLAHNTIDRISGRPLDEGGLYFDDLLYPTDDARFDVWVRSCFPADRVRRIFEQGLYGGYGRDAGTGCGRLVVTAVEPATLPTVPGANGIVTLGTSCPAADDPSDGCWNLDVRLGKLGGAAALAAGPEAVFKCPLILLARGATFRTASPRPIFGRVVPEMHPARPEVVTCGLTLTLPVRLTEEAFVCPSTT